MHNLTKLLTMLLLLVLITPTIATWQTETVDSEHTAHYSMVLDSLDNPHIVYRDTLSGGDGLMYAYWNGSNWHIETVTDDFALSASLVLDSLDYPHIAYGTGDLKYARWDGTNWQIEAVDTYGNTGRSPSLVLDTQENPHITYGYYVDYREGDLKYARWDGLAWQIETVDGLLSIVNVGLTSSLKLDEFDYPHISYYDKTNRDLKYARWNGSSWQVKTVDFEERVGNWSSLILNTSDCPHISYYDATNYDLKYARWVGIVWQVETVDSAGMVGSRTSLAFDSSDHPYISYYDQTNHYLKCTHWDGSNWQMESVDTAQVCRTSVVLDSSDNPRISYTNTPNDDLKYAWWNNPPDAFSLLYPENEKTVHEWPLADWEDAADDDNHDIIYNLTYTTDPTWETYEKINDLTASEYQFSDTELDRDTTYYWRVFASDGYDTTWATENDWWFHVADDVGVESVELASQPTDEGVLLSWFIVGDEPASVRVLRAVSSNVLTQNGSVEISGELAGSATSWLDVSVEAGMEYAYYLEVTELDGTVSRFGPSEVAVPIAVSELTLSDPYPNPADESLTIHYELTQNATVKLHIYDVAGRLVETLVSGEQTAGRHSVNWDSSTSATGVYLLRLEAEGNAITKRAVISR